jgi:hypothetical protein
MDSRFWQTVTAGFVAGVAMSFIVHGVILEPHYAQLQAVYRGPQIEPARFALLMLAQLVFTLALVGFYRFGIESKPWLGQGLRFGLLAAGLAVVPAFLIDYVVTNITGVLAVWQIVLETIRVTLLGILVAWFYRARS